MVIFMQEIKYCPKCEGENAIDHKFCVFCGEKFPTPKHEINCINMFTEQIGTGKKAKFIYNGKELFVEEVAIEFYKKKGYNAIWSENDYWGFLYALLFWDIIFLKTDTCISKPMSDPDFEQTYEFYQNSGGYDMPHDFFSPSFYIYRNTEIKEWMDFLKTADIPRILKNRYEKHYLERCRPIEDWNKYSLDELLIAPRVLSNEQFLKIMERLVFSFSDYRRGFPDLIVYNDEELFFSEVKSKKDNPSEEQIIWHDYLLKEVDVPVDLFCVNKTDRQIKNIKNKYDKVLKASEEIVDLDKEISDILNSRYVYQKEARRIIDKNKDDKEELEKVVKLLKIGIENTKRIMGMIEDGRINKQHFVPNKKELFNPLSNEN